VSSVHEHSIYLLHGDKSRPWVREETVYGQWIHSWMDGDAGRRRVVLSAQTCMIETGELRRGHIQYDGK
jgi:hypothetical protein